MQVNLTESKGVEADVDTDQSDETDEEDDDSASDEGEGDELLAQSEQALL